MSSVLSKLLWVPILGLLVVFPVTGCKKSAQELAEQKAIARHEHDEHEKKAFEQIFQGPNRSRLRESVGALVALAQENQLPGASEEDKHGSLNLDHIPELHPNGPYYWTQEFHGIIKDSPPRHLHFVLVQAYSNSDFQLQKAWRADASGKILENYPIKPAPAILGAHYVFLGPANPGGETDRKWYNGSAGNAVSFIDHTDAASGVGDFTLTNSIADKANNADWRSVNFPLKLAAAGARPIRFSFAYELPERVNAGDNVEAELRFFDKSGGHLIGEKSILVGADTGDSNMTGYKNIVIAGIHAPPGAETADVRVDVNLFHPWTSGAARFDDFSVTTSPGQSWGEICTEAGAGLLVLAGALLFGRFYFHRRPKTTPV